MPRTKPRGRHTKRAIRRRSDSEDNWAWEDPFKPNNIFEYEIESWMI